MVADEWQLSWTCIDSTCSARPLLSHLLVNPQRGPTPHGSPGQTEAAPGIRPLPVPLTVAVQVAGSCSVAVLAGGPVAGTQGLQGHLQLEELGSVHCQALKVSFTVVARGSECLQALPDSGAHIEFGVEGTSMWARCRYRWRHAAGRAGRLQCVRPARCK